MNLIMLGASGSGKGTQAKFIQRDFGLVPISTGDVLREYIKRQDPLGLEAQKYMNRGILVPEEIMLKVLKKRLSEQDVKEKGFLLEGYPRNIEQAKNLASLANFDMVILIDIEIDEIYRRLLYRKTCRKCNYLWNTYYDKEVTDKTEICPTCGGELYVRADDTREAVKNRISFYTNNIGALKEFYKDKLVTAKACVERTDTYAPIYKSLREYIDAR